jgi:hypothetical protein
MFHFFKPLQLRLFENAWHALADATGEFGRHHWMKEGYDTDSAGGPVL